MIHFLVVPRTISPPTRLLAVAVAFALSCGLLAPVAGAAEGGAAARAGVVAGPAEPADGTERGGGQTAEEPARPPSRAAGATVVKILVRTRLRARPDGGRVVWTARPQTPYNGLPQRLMALRERVVDGRRWVQVRLPARPNDATGWLLRDAVAFERTRWWIDVSVGARTVVVRRDGEVVRRMRAVVGAPATPTPRGLFAIYEKVRQPDPRAFLGTWALHLTAHSDVLDDYGGGDGRAALHGRSGASLADPLGTARSHGCVRLDNRAVDWLAARVPAGTPVRIGR